MITPFPFIIWSPDPGWPCWKRCEGKRFQMWISDGAFGESSALQGRGNWRPPHLPCLLPIFKFSAHHGTHPETSSNPCQRGVPSRALKYKKQRPGSTSLLVCRVVVWVKRASFNLGILHTKLHDSETLPTLWGVLECLKPYQMSRWCYGPKL